MLRSRFQGHSTEDVRMVARSFRFADAVQMVVFNALCNSPLVVQYLLEHFVLSVQERSGSLLFGQCLSFTSTPNDLLFELMGPCVCLSGDGILAKSSDVQGLEPTSTDPVQLDVSPAFDQAGTLLDGRFFFAF